MQDHIQIIRGMYTDYRGPVRKLVSGLLLLFALLGCAPPVAQIKVELKNEPLVDKLPISIGVYYSPPFREYEHKEGGHIYKARFFLGTASTNLFNQVLPIMFSRVEILDTRPPYSPEMHNIEAVLEPEIIDFQIDTLPRYGGFSASQGFYSWIEYQIRFYAMDGTIIASWPISGWGYYRYRVYRSIEFQKGRSGESAIFDAMAQFMVGFQHQSEIKRWLQKKGIKKDSFSQRP